MSNSDEEFLESLREDFVVECSDQIEQAEREMLDMEKDKDQSHLIEVNRRLHSAKGSARAVGYNNFSELLHDLESFILASPVKKLNYTKFTTLILKCLDGFKELNQAHAGKDHAMIKRCEDNIIKIMSDF